MSMIVPFKALEDYSLKLSSLAAHSDEVAEKALNAGAEIVEAQIRVNLQKNLAGSRTTTGDLERSLGTTPVKLDRDGNYNVKVGFAGYDSKGIPNQLKARVMESGSSRQQKRPFIRPAVRATKEKVVDAMKRVIDEEIEKNMK